VGQSLRQRALQGGAFLAIRQGTGILLSLVGVFVVTRVIGPDQYGLYAAGFGLVSFLSGIGTWGLDVYLLRKSVEPEPKEYNQAFTLLLVAGVLLGLCLWVGHQCIADNLLKLPKLGNLLGAMALGLPLNLLTLPAVVRLDRDLNFKRVALNELAAQLSYYILAVPIALHGGGAWAPVSGYLAQQLVSTALMYSASRWRPALHWEPKLIKDMLSYGFSYSSSLWIWQLRTLVNPILVGRLAGAEAVAFVALSIRFAEMLAFVKDATWRIAMATFAKLGEEPERLSRSIEEGMYLQVLAVGMPLVGFALAAPLMVGTIFGQHWLPVLAIYPFVAISYLTNALFNLHSSVLYLLRKNFKVAWFHVLHIGLFAGSALVLIPRIGYIGYGWAEICALASYPLIHLFIAGVVGSPNYRAPLLWYFALLSILVFSTFGGIERYLSPLALLLPLLFSDQRKMLVYYFSILVNRALPASQSSHPS
jgi:O-antigen/teichoic acid export membrane protein